MDIEKLVEYEERLDGDPIKLDKGYEKMRKRTVEAFKFLIYKLDARKAWTLGADGRMGRPPDDVKKFRNDEVCGAFALFLDEMERYMEYAYSRHRARRRQGVMCSILREKSSQRPEQASVTIEE